MTDEEWQVRLHRAVEQSLAARRARADQRAQFAERRRHGLTARHAAKLARRRPEHRP